MPFPFDPHDLMVYNRRVFLKRSMAGSLGSVALSALLNDSAKAEQGAGIPHFPARAKRVIFLFQAGGPAQQDLFDYKPYLNKMNGEPLPAHVRGGQRLTGMSANQSILPLAGSQFRFDRYGESGATLSEVLPHHRKIVDETCFIKGTFTDAINHDPAKTYIQTGSQMAGRPSMGAWVSYGLGSGNENLPAFIVLVSAGQSGQPLFSRLWGSGFLDSRYQGIRFRAGSEPVLYLGNPAGVSRGGREAMLDKLAALNRHQFASEHDPEIVSRVAQYEMAFKMQASVPEAVDLSGETKETYELYGPDSQKPGTYAANCLLARRLAERGVRFIQLYHQGWDQHGNLPKALANQCQETDQASAALVLDLKRRGLLNDTLIIWGGEFGRTSYSQGTLTATNYGRDHHPRCFTTWLAGGGIRPGITYGQTDKYGYNIADADGNPINPTKEEFTPGAVHIHDLQATMLHCLGIDHTRLTFKKQGRRFRLTDVHGHVVEDILA